MLTCHTPPLLFLVLYLSPLLSLFFPPLLLNLLLLRCEVILTDAVANNHKSSFGIRHYSCYSLFICCLLLPQRLGLERNIPAATNFLRLLMAFRTVMSKQNILAQPVSLNSKHFDVWSNVSWSKLTEIAYHLWTVETISLLSHIEVFWSSQPPTWL